MFRKNENVFGIVHAFVYRKEDIFRQRQLNHSEVGGGNAFKRVYLARVYSTLVVLFFFLNGAMSENMLIFRHCSHRSNMLTERPGVIPVSLH